MQLHKILDQDCMLPFLQTAVEVPGWEGEYKLVYRDVMKVIQHLVGKPSYLGHMDFKFR
jgi:hypothetical protein